MRDNTSKYRISKLKNNYFKADEDPMKKSSSFKNILTGNRTSTAQKDDQTILSRKVSHKSSTKNRLPSKRNVIEFNDVKWLAIISAYDPQKLQFVTASKQSYQKFLHNKDVINDQHGRKQFKVVIENFKRWSDKISKGYTKILNIFLYPSLTSSPIQTFSKVRPMLYSIREQSQEMHDKVKCCMQTQDYRQFRGLIVKFDTFFQASKDIEQIIYIVNKSKSNIDDLFKEIQRDLNLDKKVQRQRKRGIKEVRKAVRDYSDDQAQTKILRKVEDAINQMADRSLQAYGKIKGAKYLISRIRQVFDERRNIEALQLKDIVTINKIFQEVLSQAEEFEKFSSKFLRQTNAVVNDDLRNCIEKYLEEVDFKKKMVMEMQLKFLGNVIESTIELIQANFQISKGIRSSFDSEYQTIEGLLKDICKCLTDEPKRAIVESMMKETKSQILLAQEIICQLKQFDGVIQLDTQRSLNKLNYLQQHVEYYKQTLAKVIKKQIRSHAALTKNKKALKSTIIQEDDHELIYLANLIKDSQKFNDTSKIQEFNACTAYAYLNENLTLKQLGEQLNNIKIIKWGVKGYEHYLQLNQNNPLQTIIPELILSNPLFQVSPTIHKFYQLHSQRQADFLIELANASSLYGKYKNPQKTITRVYERTIALIVSRGLKKQLLAIVEDVNKLQFPQNQQDVRSLNSNVKYLQLVNKQIPNTMVFHRIHNTCEAIREMIEGSKLVEQLKWNRQNKYYLQNKELFLHVDQVFNNTFIKKTSLEIKQIQQRLQKCIEYLQRTLSKQIQSNVHKVRKSKISALVQEYQRINQQLLFNLQQTSQDSLTMYSQLNYHYATYLHQTKQSSHFVLNPNKQVIYLCMPNTTAYSAIGKKINAEHMSKGQIVNKYNDKNYAKVRNQKQKEQVKKQSKKKEEKKKPIDEMEQIQMEEYEQEQMEDMEEDMMEDMEDMQENMEEDMGEDMEEYEMDEDMEDMDEVEIEDVGDQMINDIQQIEQQKPTKDRKISKKQQKPPKKQPQQKEEQQTMINEKKFQWVYEQLAIQTIEELSQIIMNILNLQRVFWRDVEFTNIQEHINLHKEPHTIIQELRNKLTSFCADKFRPRIIGSVTQSQNYKQILKSITQIANANLNQLIGILTQQNISFTLLKDKKQKILWFSKGDACIENYINHHIKSHGMQFNTQSYKQHLKQQTKELSTIYTASPELSYDEKTINSQLQTITKCKQQYKWNKLVIDMSGYGDEMNLSQLMIWLWNNSISTHQHPLSPPPKLSADISMIATASSPDAFISYFTQLHQDNILFHDKLKQHHQKLHSICQHTTSANILSNISALCQIYKCKCICHNNKPIIIEGPSSTNQLTKELINLFKNINNAHQILSKTVHFEQMIKLLNILQIQTHIYIHNKQSLMKGDVNGILNAILQSSSLEVGQFDEESVTRMKDQLTKHKHIHNQYVSEYKITSQSTLHPQNNIKYQQELQAVIKQSQNRYPSQLEQTLSEHILCRVLSINQQNNISSYAHQIQQLTRSTALTNIQYLYQHHKKTIKQINDILHKLNQQITMINTINEANPLLTSTKEIHQLYETVMKWCKMCKGSNTHGKLLKINNEMCYISFNRNNPVEQVLNRVSAQKQQLYSYVKPYCNGELVQLHKLMEYSSSTLHCEFGTLFDRLVGTYNNYHFKKNNKSTLQQSLTALSQTIQNKLKTISCYLQIVHKLGPQHQLVKLLSTHLKMPENISFIQEQQTQQLANLSKVKPQSYQTLSQFYSSAASYYKLQHKQLINREGEFVCLLALNVEQSLTDIDLTPQHTLENGKVKIKSEEYRVKVVTKLSMEEWNKYKNQNYYQQPQHTLTLVILNGQKPIKTAILEYNSLIEKPMKILANINNKSITSDLAFRVQKMNVKSQILDEEVLVEETRMNVKIIDEIGLQRIGRWFDEQVQKKKQQQQKIKRQKYLSLLYKYLQQGHAFTLSKEYLFQQAQPTTQKVTSKKHTILKNYTDQMIRNSYDKIPTDELTDYQVYTHIYLQSLATVLVERQQIIEEIIESGLKMLSNEEAVELQEEKNEQILQVIYQIQNHPKYNVDVLPYAVKIMKALEGRQKYIMLIGADGK